MKQSMLKQDLRVFLKVLPVILFYIIFMQIVFKSLCPIYGIFHFPCPGCGLTRASCLLLTGNFKEAFTYNATAILWLILIFLFIFDRYIKKIKIKPFPTIFIIVASITIIYYIYRLVTNNLGILMY